MVVQAGGLRDCMPLQTLDLSGCALTDASVRCITVIVKVVFNKLFFIVVFFSLLLSPLEFGGFGIIGAHSRVLVVVSRGTTSGWSPSHLMNHLNRGPFGTEPPNMGNSGAKTWSSEACGRLLCVLPRFALPAWTIMNVIQSGAHHTYLAMSSTAFLCTYPAFP